MEGGLKEGEEGDWEVLSRKDKGARKCGEGYTRVSGQTPYSRPSTPLSDSVMSNVFLKAPWSMRNYGCLDPSR